MQFWDEGAAPDWSSAIERAAAGQNRLGPRDRAMTDALLLFNRGFAQNACELLGRLTRQYEHAFTTWYGLATCLNRDRVVVPDARSPSGFRFRSDYGKALRAYRRAFQLFPPVQHSLRDDAFRAVRTLLMTENNDLLFGRAAPPDTTTFFGRASWEGDSLVVVPFRATGIQAGRPETELPGHRVAVRRQRELLRDMATGWVATSPDNPHAIGALALALELVDSSNATEMLHRARALTTDPADALRLGAAEVWIGLKYALPDDRDGILRARALADSLLTAFPERGGPDPLLFSSLAVLLGRAGLAADLARRAVPAGQLAPPAMIARTAPALLVFAALGGPRDSLAALELQVSERIRALRPDDRATPRAVWLARAAMVSFPDQPFATIAELEHTGEALIDAQAASMRQDSATVRAFLRAVAPQRLANDPADRTIDFVFSEAALYAAVNEPRRAAHWLDSTLHVLPRVPRQSLSDPVRAGTLVRAMVLRADLAARLRDDRTAARWAAAVALLWSDADDFLKPVVTRMRALASPYTAGR